MMAFRFRLLLPLAVLAACVQPIAPPPAAAQQLQVPPLEHRARTLANGARVFTMRDTTASVVSVNVWYDVGQRDDPRGRAGFAHLFEHLMFRTTRNLPEGVGSLVTDRGGQTNASTLFDYTSYFVQAPANQLETLIWLEGERLRNLVIDEPSFVAERDVVKEELRQRVLAQPYGRILYTLLPAYLFSTHPYARPIGGTIEDLDRATLADVRAFHEAYYRPDNAIIVVSGNFDPAELDRWIDRYIGTIERPAAAIPRDDRREAAPLAARTVEVFAPNAPLPALVLAWRAPAADHPDAAALALIDAILTRGPSSRLRRALVDEQGVASSITSYNLPARDGHAFGLVINLAQQRTLGEAQAAAEAELARLRDAPLSTDELAAVRNGLLGDALGRRETPRGRAFELGGGVALTGEPAYEDRRLATIMALTPEQVRAAAGRLLDPAHRLTLHYRNESERPQGYTPPAGADVAEMGPEVPPARRAPIVLATEGEREAVPAPGPERPRTVPPLTSRRLRNGLTLVHARTSDVPVTTLRLVIAGGDSLDPAEKAGLGDLLAATAVRGAEGLDAAAIATRVDSLGGSLQASAEPDATTISLTVPTSNAADGGRLLADIVTRPALPTAELDRARSQQVAALTVASRQPVQVALRALGRSAFGGSPYGNVPTAQSLAAVTRDDLAAAHRASWTPERVTLIVTGSMAQADALALAERLFGGWSGRATAPLPQIALDPATARPQVVVVDLPGAGQTAVVTALPVPGRLDPNWTALRVAGARLGGGQRGFLNQEIRVRRGLSYSAGSLFDARRGATLLIGAAQTRNDAAAQVAEIMLAQFRRVAEEPASAADAAERRAYVGNALASQIERSAGFAAFLGDTIAGGGSLEQAARELRGEPDVSAEALAAVARAGLRADRATLILAGDSRQWIEAVRARYPDLRRVDVDGRLVAE